MGETSIKFMSGLYLGIFCGLQLLSFVGAVTVGSCISCCNGIPDGNYQSCQGCGVYASCGGGIFYDNRLCPGGLVWDDSTKLCGWTSSTCSGPQQRPPAGSCEAGTAPTPAPTTPSNKICVSSCNGIPDGDYQSCNGCNVYASCGGGILYDNRPCPWPLFWDDNFKRCEYESSTCSGSTIATTTTATTRPTTTTTKTTRPTTTTTTRATTRSTTTTTQTPATTRTLYVTLPPGWTGWLPNIDPVTGKPIGNTGGAVSVEHGIVTVLLSIFTMVTFVYNFVYIE